MSIYASLVEWYTQQAQTLSLIGSQFDSEERYKEDIKYLDLILLKGNFKSFLFLSIFI